MNIGVANFEQKIIATDLVFLFNNLAYKVNLDALKWGLINGEEWKLRADKIDKDLEEKLKSICSKK